MDACEAVGKDLYITWPYLIFVQTKMLQTPKRLFLYLCISISLLRPYTLFSRSPLVNKTLFEDVATTDFEKATLLAKYFASQCTSTAPQEHLKGAPFPLPEKQPTFDFLPITELTVLRTLQHLPISKATAHPLITNQVLRECAPIICPSITHLFNLSITTGVFPDAWKRATVTPIFKNRGTAGDPSNYRPVSLLPAMGKVLDRIQSSCLLQHLVQHNLISPHQFGFIPGKSVWQVSLSKVFELREGCFEFSRSDIFSVFSLLFRLYS